jgi:hypothetical protein
MMTKKGADIAQGLRQPPEPTLPWPKKFRSITTARQRYNVRIIMRTDVRRPIHCLKREDKI